MARIVDLWRRAHGPPNSFEAAVAPYVERLHRLAWRLTGHSPEEAEELLQELLLRLYRDGGFQDREDPGSWLNRVLYNLWVDRLRRQGARVPFEDVALDDDALGVELPGRTDSEPGELTERALTAERIVAALDQLPQAQRLAIVLHDAEGYTLPEIAEMTGVTTGTLKSRLSRARASLRSILSRGTVSDPHA